MKLGHDADRCAASMPSPHTACVNVPTSVPSIRPSTDRAALCRVLLVLRLRMAGQVLGRRWRDEAPQEVDGLPRLLAADVVRSVRAAAVACSSPCGRQPLPQAVRRRSKLEVHILAGSGGLPAHGSPSGAAGSCCARSQVSRIRSSPNAGGADGFSHRLIPPGSGREPVAWSLCAP